MSAKSTKAPNFTVEQTQEIKSVYVAAKEKGADYNALSVIVADFAEKFGKSTRSIAAKLTREGVYVAKEYVSKTGEKPIGKEDIATEIGSLLGLSEPEADSLSKANKGALTKILDFVKAEKQ
jgi:hypothetical protein